MKISSQNEISYEKYLKIGSTFIVMESGVIIFFTKCECKVSMGAKVWKQARYDKSQFEIIQRMISPKIYSTVT